MIGILANVEIVDLTGVPTSGTLVPRIYYAKNLLVVH